MSMEELSDDQLALRRMEVVGHEHRARMLLAVGPQLGLDDAEIHRLRIDVQSVMCDVADVDEEIERRGKVFDIAMFGGYPVLRGADR